jgi:hypothetical protein
MSLATPDKIRDLQIKLYRKAKKEPEFRFHQLYDKVYREDILIHAYRLAKSNDGAPGVGEVSFEDIESGGPQGVMEWLNGLGTELHDKTYKPQPVGDRVFLYTQKTGVPVSVKLPAFVVEALNAMPKVSSRYFFSLLSKLAASLRGGRRRAPGRQEAEAPGRLDWVPRRTNSIRRLSLCTKYAAFSRRC